MNNITSPSVWDTLSVPMPAEFIHHASLNRQIETLEKKNNTSTYIILGLGLLLVGVSFYLIVEKERERKIFIAKDKRQ
jgi:hypothetical protein